MECECVGPTTQRSLQSLWGLIASKHGTFLLQPKSKTLVIESQYPANKLVELVEKEDRHEAGERKQKDVQDVV